MQGDSTFTSGTGLVTFNGEINCSKEVNLYNNVNNYGSLILEDGTLKSNTYNKVNDKVEVNDFGLEHLADCLRSHKYNGLSGSNYQKIYFWEHFLQIYNYHRNNNSLRVPAHIKKCYYNANTLGGEWRINDNGESNTLTGYNGGGIQGYHYNTIGATQIILSVKEIQ